MGRLHPLEKEQEARAPEHAMITGIGILIAVMLASTALARTTLVYGGIAKHIMVFMAIRIARMGVASMAKTMVAVTV